MRLQRALVLLLSVCLASVLVAASPTLPDTPQGRRMDALMKAFAKGTPDALRAFISANFSDAALSEAPVEQRVQRLSGIVQDNGPLELSRVMDAAGNASFLVHATKSGNWIEVSLNLEEAPPQKIRSMRLNLRPGPDAGPERDAAPPEARKASDAKAAAAARARSQELARNDAFSGVVLMAKDGKPFLLEAAGMADRGLAVPNRTDTKFNIGSINKIFTQVAIAQLAAEGKLSLTDSIRKHLPETKIPDADRITIQQLLTMTSGMGDLFGEKFEATAKDRIRTLRDYLAMFETDPLRFSPGTGRAYSNAGYVVLGLIVEKASGRDYHDYVREKVFAPAGMKNTDANSPDAIVANRAVGYTREKPGDPWRSNVYVLPGRSSSAGGGYSTAEDLLAFDRALRGDRLLPREWTDWFFGEKSAPAPAAGAAPRKRSGGFGFAGGTGGANAVVESDLDTGYTLVVLANQDPPAAEGLMKSLRQWLGLK
jgi:CubicO group peptidase (beta-lactamase class C family)